VLPHDSRHRCRAFSPFQRRQRLTKARFRLLSSVLSASTTRRCCWQRICTSFRHALYRVNAPNCSFFLRAAYMVRTRAQQPSRSGASRWFFLSTRRRFSRYRIPALIAAPIADTGNGVLSTASSRNSSPAASFHLATDVSNSASLPSCLTSIGFPCHSVNHICLIEYATRARGSNISSKHSLGVLMRVCQQ
jgi:hypothetical protein